MVSRLYDLADRVRSRRLGEYLAGARARGESYRDIRDALAGDGIDVSHETIRRWCHELGIEEERAS